MSQKVAQEGVKKRWLRLDEIVGDRSASPPIEPIIPVSKSTIYRLVAAGKFPAPVKPLPSISLWSSEEVNLALKSWGQGHE